MGIEALFDGSMEAETQPPVIEPEVTEPQPEAPVEPTPEPEQPAPETPKDEGRHIPLAVALDWRDEAKRLKAELASRDAQVQPATTPDPYDDPSGFAAAQEAKFEQRLTQQKFETSDLIARQQHGAETVEAAATWATERAKQDPSFAASYMRQPHPIDWIVQQHKRDALLADVGDNVDDFIAREAAKRGYVIPPAPNAAASVVAQQQPAPVPTTPPRSLASAPSKGGGIKDVPTGPLSALGAVFER